MLDPAGPWTFDQLSDLPDDGRRYEVVDGHLVVTPPPSQQHQVVANRLHRQLLLACPPQWEVVFEFPLPMGSDGRVPDLAVVRRQPLPGDVPPYPIGPADFGLVVEVTSGSTRKTDLFAKPGEYAEAGIPLFWRVERRPELAVHGYRLGAAGYEIAAVVRGSGGTCPAPWGDVHLDLERIRTG
jgi:Uma2 family endonuclease